MKLLVHKVFSVQGLILLLAVVMALVSPVPVELLQLDRELFEIAGGTSQVDPAQYLQQPHWFSWASKVVWCLIVCLVLWILPWPNTSVALLITLIAVGALTVIQLGAQFRHALWLPLGLTIQFLLISSPIILWWSRRRRAWGNIIDQRDSALLELSAYKIKQGQLEQAIKHLHHCLPSPQVAEQAYDIALQQEQRRDHKGATITYQWLASFAPKYKDVTEKARGKQVPANSQDATAFAATQSIALSSEQQRQPVLGRYRIEQELGRGAMGTVYLGVDPKISRHVAIKTLSYPMFKASELEEVKQRFFREAEAAGRLTHPNIVTVYDVGEEVDLSFIAMDFIDGPSLREYIDSDQLLDISTAYQLISQVADALDYAHQQNIVHRDIKPGNLLYDQKHQQVKVADFGIARIVDNSTTKTGDILGSPIYMSPEQLKGHKVSGSSDIYSLGVTFYQLLTGATPYSGDSIANLAYNIIHKKFKSPKSIRPELPSSAARIINKAMAKDPDKRFENALAMSQAIKKSLRKDFGIGDS